MKHPVYWFLLSSGLVASTYASFAAVDEKTLTSADSYDGNTAAAAFTTQDNTSTDGTNYTCTGDICIAFAGKGAALTNSCFNQSQGNLSFTGTGGSLCFDNINGGTTKPAAIEVAGADKTLSVTGFSLFSCISCPPGTTGHGAISSKGATAFDNDVKLLFQKNCSSDNGGAITCKGFTLQNTSNSATFADNTSAKAGGALYSTGTTTISNNNSVVFSGNSTTGTTSSTGGAISCTDTTNAPELKLEGNKKLVFANNIAGTSGGAIHANKLIITAGGPTLFTNNSVTAAATPTGGAISLNGTSGECSLTAELGDIIFDGNTITTTTTPGSTKRNAIDLSSTGKFMKLNAREGFGIYFYDPIADNGDTTTEIELNQAGANSTYTGKIVFSGEKLTDAEKAIADNLKSSFKQPLKVGAGSLVLKDGVVVEAKSVSQTAGSAVVMDVGTTLQTPTTSGSTITLENLEINVSSLGGGGCPLLLKS